MAKNKKPLRMDIEEGPQGANTTSNELKLISNQEKEPTTETDICRVDFPILRSCSQFPFLWRTSENDSYCCIYRVPCRLRRVNPEAYTPQMLLIGPLHHSKKADEAVELSKTDVRYLDYMKMERHKERYLENFEQWYGNQMVEEFRRIIRCGEQIIRACYAESTESIESHDFVEMLLHDSVFILVFFMQLGPPYIDYKTGDFLFDEPCYQNTIFEDLILLENQLPCVLLEKLFDCFFTKVEVNLTFRDFILRAFDFKDKNIARFLHFTDLLRGVRVETLGICLTEDDQIREKFERKKRIKNIYNANELDIAGVEFEGFKDEKDTSLVIKFEKETLTMPCFIAGNDSERILRNIMALEQTHYSYTAFVCNYITFLNFLIDTEQDVEFLVKKGIIKNWLGRSKSVAYMVNKLCLGIVDYGSYFYDVAERLNRHYEDHPNFIKIQKSTSLATLQKVYFKDLWTGTATVGAVVILVLTLIGTVASVLQVKQKDNNHTN